MVWRALAILACSLGGCASTGPSEHSEAVPRDFAVSVAVTNPVAGLEPAWYIVEADGTFRAALGAPTPRSPIPPRVRTLTPGARLAVWRAVKQARWIPGRDEAMADEMIASTEVAVDLADVYVAAGGGRWSGRVLEAPDSIEAARLKSVIRELRRLAWLPDSPG